MRKKNCNSTYNFKEKSGFIFFYGQKTETRLSLPYVEKSGNINTIHTSFVVLYDELALILNCLSPNIQLLTKRDTSTVGLLCLSFSSVFIRMPRFYIIG